MKTLFLALFFFVCLFMQAQVSLHPEKAISRDEPLSFIADDVQFICFDSIAGTHLFTDHFITRNHIILFRDKDIMVCDSNGSKKNIIKSDSIY